MTTYTLDSFVEKFGNKEENNKKAFKYNVYFISDMHINHNNILKHQPNRIKDLNLKDEHDVEGMDAYIYKMWDETLNRGDHVYLLGDTFLCDKDKARKGLLKLKRKGVQLHLIVGNHDKYIPQFYEQFNDINYIKTATFKKSVFEYMDEDFRVCMCHYPMISWPDKCRGSVLLYGHVHDNAPFIDKHEDMTLNVGFDTEFAHYKLIPLKRIWEYFKSKRGNLTATEYIEEQRKNPLFVG